MHPDQPELYPFIAPAQVPWHLVPVGVVAVNKGISLAVRSCHNRDVFYLALLFVSNYIARQQLERSLEDFFVRPVCYEGSSSAVEKVPLERMGVKPCLAAVLPVIPRACFLKTAPFVEYL